MNDNVDMNVVARDVRFNLVAMLLPGRRADEKASDIIATARELEGYILGTAPSAE